MFNPIENQRLHVSQSRFYVIQSGDTLSQIAEKMKCSLKTLILMNGIKNPDLIYPGELLYIC